MRLSAKFVLMSLLLLGCERQKQVPKIVERPPLLPTVGVMDVPAPATATVTVQKGTTLGQIAAAAYGHERFSGFMKVLNKLENEDSIRAGQTLQTPSLAVAFQTAGLDPAYQPTVNVLAKAATDFFAVLPAYLEARRASGVREGNFDIPDALSSALLNCADSMEAAIAELRQIVVSRRIPNSTLSQFAQAAQLIRALSGGSIDGYGYDYDLIGQRLGYAFTNALNWTQERPR